MMRVLFCLTGPDELNGPNVWLTRHLPRLRAYGIEPRALYLSTTPETPCRFRSALEAEGIAVRSVKIIGATECDVLAILEAVASEHPACFVPNCAAPAYFASQRVRAAGVRTVGVLHADDPWYLDILDLFVAGPEPWRLDGVVAVSGYLRDLALARATSSTRVVQATCGAPVDDVVAVEPGDTLRLLYVGRLVERQKRILRLADRLCAAATAVPGVRATLYGTGEDRPSVEALVASRAPDRVNVAWLAADEVTRAMGEGHVLVLLSDFEGMSMALMEGMACGLVPIVADTRSGTADLIEHEGNALVVDPDDEEAFIAAVRRLREEPGLWRRLSRAARETIVLGGCTADECARRWAAFCRSLGPAEAPRPIDIPDVDNLDLPDESSRPFGLRVADWRGPSQRLLDAQRRARPIYVWGGGRGGALFLAGQTGRRLTIAGVIDRRAQDGMSQCEGVAVYPPSRLEDDLRAARRPFVVIASMAASEISDALERMGLESGRDFNLAGCWP